MKRTLILLLGLLLIVLFSSCAKKKEESEKKVITVSEVEDPAKVTIHLKDGSSIHSAEIRAAVYNDRTASIFIDYTDPINVEDIQSIEIKP